MNATAAAASPDDAGTAPPVDAPFVDPAAAAAAPAEQRQAALARAFDGCAAAAETCIPHCQQQLATGDAALADCLRAALDADAVAVAIGRLARNRSAWAAVLAKQSLSILDACVEACRPHRAAHPACRACFDACGKAIATTRAA